MLDIIMCMRTNLGFQQFFQHVSWESLFDRELVNVWKVCPQYKHKPTRKDQTLFLQHSKSSVLTSKIKKLYNFMCINYFLPFFKKLIELITYLIFTVNNQRTSTLNMTTITHFSFTCTQTARLNHLKEEHDTIKTNLINYFFIM